MITGGIKVFDENVCLLDNGGAVVASTGTVVENNAIDKNPLTYWTSVASNDSTVETLTITFGSATFNRLLLLDHNWKQFTAQYWNGSAYVDFASVVGIDGALGGGIVSETVFADTAAYYEFTPVTSTRIQITVTKTQTANADKYIGTIFAANELGTLQGFPTVDPLILNKNSRIMQMVSGRSKIVKSNQVFGVTLKFVSYPGSNTTYAPDLDLMLTLFDRQNPFHIWLCGGRRGSKYFGYQFRGWRLKDVFRVQCDSNLSHTYEANFYKHGLNFDVVIYEST